MDSFGMTAKHPNIRVTLNAAGDDFRIIDHVMKAFPRRDSRGGD
jgi:hypothetical protein